MIFLSSKNYKKDEMLDLLEKGYNLELRMDLIDIDFNSFSEIVEKYKNLIITFKNITTFYQKSKYLSKVFEENIKYIDIDIKDYPGIQKELRKFEKISKTGIILSYHNYKRTPEKYYLDKIVKKALNYNPDIIKIATLVDETKDIFRLLGLMENKKVFSFGMGQKGLPLRIIFKYLNYPVEYAAVEDKQKTAKYQLTLEKLKKIRGEIDELLF